MVRLSNFLHGRRILSVVALVFGVFLCLLPLRLDPNRSFQDMRTVTHSIQCVEIGKDPYVDTCDPWNRVYNYPPIWLTLGHLGVGPRQTNLLGVSFALLTLASLLYLFRTLSTVRTALAVAAFVSYPVFFGMKEGNIDQAIFGLLVFGSAALGSLRRFRSAGLIVALTVLKVFPMVTALVFWRTRRAAWKVLATVVVSAAALELTAGPKLFQALHNTPHAVLNSFGGYTTLMLTLQFVHGQGVPSEHQVAHMATVGFALLGLVVFGICARRHTALALWFPPVTGRPREVTAVAGLLIYCAVFVMSSSYAYRLLFLLPAFALLLDDTEASHRSPHVLPVAYLFLAGLLLPYVNQRPSLLLAVFGVSLIHAALFFVCMAWLAVTFCEWPVEAMPARRSA